MAQAQVQDVSQNSVTLVIPGTVVVMGLTTSLARPEPVKETIITGVDQHVVEASTVEAPVEVPPVEAVVAEAVVAPVETPAVETNE